MIKYLIRLIERYKAKKKPLKISRKIEDKRVLTNIIVAQHPDRIVYITESYDWNGNPVMGLCGSTTNLEKMKYHLAHTYFPKEQRFASEVPQIEDPRAKVLRELTLEEKTKLGVFSR